jgi:outer membrane protein OmpA-like peptidoglycan-associated protein
MTIVVSGENQTTTLFGATVGPRVSFPLSDLDLHLPVVDLLELYTTVQGGPFTGLSGRVGKTNGGFLAGVGLDVNVTPQIAAGLFANFNRAYISARPHFLYRQVEDEQGPADAQWVTAGVSVKYSFRGPEAPPPPPPLPPPAPPAEKTEVILRAVHFDFNKYDLRPDAIPVLDEAVQILESKGGEVWIICEGHTDSTGTVKYNLKLSRQRAETVKRYLVKHGIPDQRVRIEGLGKSKPIATNATPEGRAENRRVEIHVE